ncbi:efflux RND transporter permease subunit [Pseudohongiella sp.]|uniref:SSD domain-containing protein n=1 Tax=marine sediment metagenome TaxID=412755 RepID=A0A0F9W9F7_9ZZZZ|nr:MMPL family transporter [Pseudohongiella sp.]
MPSPKSEQDVPSQDTARQDKSQQAEGIFSSLKAGFIKLMLNWPGTILAGFLILVAILGWQARHFEIDASPDTLLTQGNELYIQTQDVNQRYAPQEFLLLTYEPTGHELYSETTFTSIRSLTAAVLAMERVESVRNMLNVPLFANVDNVQDVSGDLENMTINDGEFQMQQIEEEFDDHPIYADLLVNREQTAAALQILFRTDARLQELNGRINALNSASVDRELTQQEQQELETLSIEREPIEQALEQTRIEEIDQLRALAAEYADEANIRLGGVHVIAYQLIEIISNDLVIFGAAIAVMICLVLLILFRSLRWILIPVVCCICSVLPTIGLLAMFGMKATVISANFIALQLILTLAIVIHLIVQYRQLAESDNGLTQRELVRATLDEKMGPCFFAGITTSVGFASLVFSGIQPVISFGWMMIIAMSVSIVVSLILFPVLIDLLPREKVRKDLSVLVALVKGFRALVLKYQAVVWVLCLLILGVGVSGAMRLSVENSFINYFKPSTQIYQELAYIDQHFGGTTPLDIIYTLPEQSGDPDIVMSAESVLSMQRIQNRLNRYDATGRILSPVNMTDLAREVNNDRPLTEYELTALYWMMDESFRDDLIGSFFDEDNNQVRFNIWVEDLTEGLNRAGLLQSVKNDMSELGIAESEYQLTNLFMLYQDIMQQLADSQVTTLAIVYIALTLTFMLIFKSLTVALVAIAPNLLSTAAIFGVMGWVGLPLDLMTITIAAIVMGIAVDDTIHYVHRYLAELKKAGNAAEAVTRSHATVGMAMLYTSLLIGAGFSMLAFSDFVPSVVFGLLTALAMLLALLADLCLLPLLLSRFVTAGKSVAG